MTQSDIHNNKRQDIKTHESFSVIDQSEFKTPLETIRSWYDSQSDEAVKTDFINSTSYFHPDTSVETALDSKRRKEHFTQYLSIEKNQRREIVRRTLYMVGLIDLVLDSKKKEEASIGVPDMTYIRWMDWIDDWKKLRKSILNNQKISDWFFHPQKARNSFG